MIPEGNYELTWADEFDGTELDRSKWEFRLNLIGRRWESWTDSEEALHLDGNSHAVFKICKDEKTGNLVCAQLQTGANFMDEPWVSNTVFNGKETELHWPIGHLHEQRALFKYGYFECRARLQQKLGWWSAFWMQSPTIGTTLDAALSGAEVDIMECFAPGKVSAHNVFARGYGLDQRRTKVFIPEMRGEFNRKDVDPTGWHRFGLLWTPDHYDFYIDGEFQGSTTNDVSQVPEFLLVSTEVKGYRVEGHKPKEEAYEAWEAGDEFLVDYVRVFKEKPVSCH